MGVHGAVLPLRWSLLCAEVNMGSLILRFCDVKCSYRLVIVSSKSSGRDMFFFCLELTNVMSEVSEPVKLGGSFCALLLRVF